MSNESVPQVFIIESLDREDESHHREGNILYNILRMMGRKPKYTYIRTGKELSEIALEFTTSRYRYLHISCHGNTEGFALTYDDVSFKRFAAIFAGLLHERRVFLSACEIAQRELAQRLFDAYETAPYSATGPCEEIEISTLAAIWASLYDLLFRKEGATVAGLDIRKYLRVLCNLNDVRFRYFGRLQTAPYFKEYRLPK